MTGIKKLCILLLTETFKSCLRFEIYNRIRKLSGGDQKRLLLAEDEKEFSKALTAILKHNGYLVDAVYNGKDALDYLLGGDYDCAILDIMMPLLDGISVLKGIRHDGLDLPVIMLTAKSEIDDRVFGLDSGADDYVTKPFVAKELIARIRAVTRRKSETYKNMKPPHIFV